MLLNNTKRNKQKVLSSFKVYLEALDTGKIISVKDGVARVNGLFGVLSGEMVHSRRSFTSSSRVSDRDKIADIIEFAPGNITTWIQIHIVLAKYELKISNKELSDLVKMKGGIRKRIRLGGEIKRVVFNIRLVFKETEVLKTDQWSLQKKKFEEVVLAIERQKIAGDPPCWASRMKGIKDWVKKNKTKKPTSRVPEFYEED